MPTPTLNTETKPLLPIDCDPTIATLVDDASTAILETLRNDINLAAKYVRMAFHDCVGGCDGCVDMLNPDNAGLDIPFTALQPIVDSYEPSGLSRADIWSLASMVGLNFVYPDGDDFFVFDHFGRINCEDAGEVCRDEAGNARECNMALGPHRELPPANLDTDGVMDFFADEFGFTDGETVALMGAHSIGRAFRENSGFLGPVGWDGTPEVLDNDYYRRLVGDDAGVHPFADAPGWGQQNRGTIADPRWQWEQGGDNRLGLNADIALVRTFGDNLQASGQVDCRFKLNRDNPQPDRVCPGARTILKAIEFHQNEETWYIEFRDVMYKMITHDYEDRDTCLSPTTSPVPFPTPAPVPVSNPVPISTPSTIPSPTASPVPIPTLPPNEDTVPLLPIDCDPIIATLVDDASTAILETLRNDINLAAKYVRMAFHDCVGGCDGCVDMLNPDNAGLDIPFTALQPIVDSYEPSGLSRADIWSLASMVGLNFVYPDGDDFFVFDHFGRINCEDAGEVCRDEAGNARECNMALGPHRELPPANLDTDGVMDFFADEFGFTDGETVALMGAHSIGRAFRENSGFLGPVGWDGTPEVLDNDYYRRLVGDDAGVHPFADAPGWGQQNRGTIADPRWQWEQGGDNRLGLNADIALVRTFGDNLQASGQVDCRFKLNRDNPQPDRVCPGARTILKAIEFHQNEETWYIEFRDVMYKMITHDYEDRDTCLSPTTSPVPFPTPAPVPVSNPVPISTPSTIPSPTASPVPFPNGSPSLKPVPFPNGSTSFTPTVNDTITNEPPGLPSALTTLLLAIASLFEVLTQILATMFGTETP